jgi:hypothetical protein
MPPAVKIEPVVAEVASVVRVELTPPAAVSRPLRAVVPVTARALEPMVAPPIAKDVAEAEPSDGLKLEEMVHAMVSTISPTAAAVPSTTVEPVVAVYSEVESLEPL